MPDMQDHCEADDSPRRVPMHDFGGLVGVGGMIEPETLLRAYSAGVFPWSSDPAPTWWCPDPRAVFDIQAFRPARRLRRRIRHAGWTFALDRDFTRVMRLCAEPSAGRPSTWITEDFVTAYTELHRRGFAHSVEVLEGGEVVGGLYGVSLGGFFGGESMFRHRADASKAALAHLVEHLRARGFVLLDAQVPTPHLSRLGAVEISRSEYLRRLRLALALEVSF